MHLTSNVEIMTIGDELLIGQVVDTNSAWMGQQLNAIGLRVHQITSVSDNEQHILDALFEASKRSSLVLITGGLGPTKDDITKKTLCKYFNVGMRFDGSAYENVARIFRERGREVTETNRSQAEVPENCITLNNQRGTAPGMWFEKEGVVYVSMPGVPTEMKGLMEHEVLPRLSQRFNVPPVLHRTILTQGIGESMLSDMLEGWEAALPAHMKLAYLPAAGMVRLRITAAGKLPELLRMELAHEEEKLLQIINEYVFGFDNDRLEAIVGKLLTAAGNTLSTAESCTGGYIAHRVTAIPGSSAYFKGSIISYSNDIKTSLLDVPKEMLEKHGAVSESVVRCMAEQVRIKLRTDYSIAASGIAGPTGATDEKPLGLVWIAVSGPQGTETRKLQLGTGRERVIHETALYALNLLRHIMMKVQSG